jgi:predicted nuclease of predicted toxin-antitoxin system
VKLKIDENLPEEVAEIFQAAGHDALTVRDEHLSGASDTAVARAIQREQRALVTFDLGFADIRRHPPAHYSGIVVLRLTQQDKRHVREVILRMLPMLYREELSGRLWIVAEGQIRIRPAP